MSSTGKANAVLVAAVAFLLLSSCGAYFSFVRLQTSALWVRHSLDVQHALDHFSTTFSRAGRLRSQFVDSGDPSLLSRQAEAVVEVRNALALVQKLTADNVNQQRNWQKLAQITERRISSMERTIDLKRSGKSTLESQVPLNREIVTAAEATEGIVVAMEDEEQLLLSERQSREGGSFTVIAGVLLTTLFLALVLFLVHHQMIMDQVRERTRAEGAQRNLSARLLTLQDEERRRFARELHDSVGQHLAAIKMGVSMLERKLGSDPIVLDCLKLADDAISETRTISHLLHPPLLDEAGLNSAIRWFVEGFAKRSGIEVNVKVLDSAQRYDDSVELVLFRTLQESLTNVHRHSGARRAEVSLTSSRDSVTLRVRDHGRGIPVTQLQNFRVDGTGGGVGLAGMSERIREIRGRLEVHSTADGTEVVAQVPVRPRSVPQPEIIATSAQEVNG